MATQTALDPKVTEFIKYLTMIQTELRNLKTPEPRRARLYNRLFLVAKSLNNILKARMTDSQLKRQEINIEWFEELIANLDTLGPQIMPAFTNFDEELRIIKQLCYGKSKYHRPDTFPDKTIVGNDIYNLVAATHQVARLKRLIRKKSIDDKNLRSERTQFETRITALLGTGMRQIGCNSWVEYICKKPEIAHEKLTPTIADLLHTMRYLEYQYVLLRRTGDDEDCTLYETPVLMGFTTHPTGTFGSDDDLKIVFVYNADSWDAFSLVNSFHCMDGNDEGKVKNPKRFGMTGKNIRWKGIHH